MNIIYFGRLTEDKGFDYLLELIAESIKQNLDHNFYIFGAGNLEQKICTSIPSGNIGNKKNTSDKKLVQYKPTKNRVIICGKRKFKTTIKPLLDSKIDYTIIPSRFIETFGLTALESITSGVPIITSDQPALNQFNSNTKKISFELNQDLKLLANLIKPNRENTKKTSRKYSTRKWLETFKAVVPNRAKKILLVSDFIDTIGGAEIHIQQVKEFLSHKGYKVELFSSNRNPNLINQIKAVWNPLAKFRIRKKITKFQPHIIWCHSTQRYLGTEVLKEINGSKSFKIMTIHDFGLFSTRPSRLESMEQISTIDKTISGKLKEKLIQKPITAEINKFDKVFVPSEFMIKPISKTLKVDIITLPHFIQND
jgi:glycosyltransferase involved in cell wall biosynthesis